MIVNRRTFNVRPGRMEETVALVWEAVAAEREPRTWQVLRGFSESG
jgi:hypothetical protein